MSNKNEQATDLFGSDLEPELSNLERDLDRAFTTVMPLRDREIGASMLRARAAAHHGTEPRPLRPEATRWVEQGRHGPASLPMFAKHSMKARWTALALGAGLLAAVSGLSGVAAAPFVRADINNTAVDPCVSGAGWTYPDGHFTMCTFGFQLMVPSYTPAGLTQRETVHIAAHQGKYGGWMAMGLPLCYGHRNQETCNSHIVTGLGGGSGGLAQLYKEGADAAWIVWAAPVPATGYLELSERAAGGYSEPASGTSILIHGAVTAMTQVGPETTLDFVQSGARITIRTNVGRSDAVKVAESM